MGTRDYYQVLGVSRTASQDEIKKAYKRLAKRYHPDRNRGGKAAEERFKELSAAYQTLSNPEARRHYDLAGFYAEPGFPPYGRGRSGADPGAGYRWSGSGRQEQYPFTGDPAFHDLFREIFNNRTRAADRGTRHGEPAFFRFDLEPEPYPELEFEAEITISFEEAIRGGIHRLSLEHPGLCPTCRGTGLNARGRSRVCAACNGTGGRTSVNAGSTLKIQCNACGGRGQISTEPCPECRGCGRRDTAETVAVRIPAGVDDGGRLRIPGKGPVRPDGTRGDLYLRVYVRPHPMFRREGQDLHLDLPVSVTEAALGGSVEVPTLEGRAWLRIPQGSQSGAVLRMRGKGVPTPNRGSVGDLLVHLRITVPRNLDAEMKRMFEELRQHEPNPRDDQPR